MKAKLQRRLTLLIFSLLIASAVNPAFSQTVVLNTQTEVNAFIQNYSPVNPLYSLTIDGLNEVSDPITDLKGFFVVDWETVRSPQYPPLFYIFKTIQNLQL